ncbi:putative glycine-rich cell wall structural protein 1 [Orbicella faveolata]|uniref:putative glycine-rich cell wall structural protein 1 n=1 Tax=Orbicella faveolata TaxID=48498 RepID=UPI0009E493EB|nr:putative glycine-rich cell wall structural protein 1 [Orbicella faveolata]
MRLWLVLAVVLLIIQCQKVLSCGGGNGSGGDGGQGGGGGGGEGGGGGGGGGGDGGGGGGDKPRVVGKQFSRMFSILSEAKRKIVH